MDGKHASDTLIIQTVGRCHDQGLKVTIFITNLASHFADIEGLSQQLMAQLAKPTHGSSSIFIDDPTSKRSALGPRQIEVRCVYLEDFLGKICCCLLARLLACLFVIVIHCHWSRVEID